MSAILKQKLIDIANGFTKYGLWKGGGSSNLSELDDVTLTNLKTNDVLTYNGSVWVNDDTLNSNLNNKNKTFTLANTEANGSITLLDDFRNYNFLDVLLVGNYIEFISSIYIPTELIDDGFKIFPSYTSDLQKVVYITIVNGTTITCANNGDGKKVILVGVDKKN